MNQVHKKAVQELLRIARSLVGFEMTESEWKVYEKKHPHADPENHNIVPDSKGEGKKSPAESDGGEKKKQDDGVTTKKPQTELIKQYKHHVMLSAPALKQTLSHGHYSVISAGKNPNDPDEKDKDQGDPMFHERHLKLRDDLEEAGLKYTEVIGNYGSGPERSFLVLHDHQGGLDAKTSGKAFMVHRSGHATEELSVVEKLGTKYKQDSILHGDGGKNRIHFTTGKHKGKDCGGEGWEEAPDAKDFYTDIELKKGQHTKFRTNIDGCFKEGYM